MSNPYFWDFPQRNDTMYMSTIGLHLFTQKTNQGHGIVQEDNRHFRKRISKGLFRSSKFLKLSPDKTIVTQPIFSQGLKTTKTSRRLPILFEPMILNLPIHKQSNSGQTECLTPPTHWLQNINFLLSHKYYLDPFRSRLLLLLNFWGILLIFRICHKKNNMSNIFGAPKTKR